MKRILNYPQVYNFYQNLIGTKPYLKNLAENFIKPRKGMKILDLGCGTANILQFLGDEVEYVGVDFSSRYIDYASKKYKKHRFINADITASLSLNEKFDVIISEGVMAAFNDKSLKKMFKTIVSLSSLQTRIILSDMNFRQDACLLQKFLQSNERNKYLRNKFDYLNLLNSFFNVKNITELDNVYRIPYQKLIFECQIKC